MLAAKVSRKTKVPTKNRLMQNHRQLPHWMSSRTSRAARAGRVSQHAGAGSSEFAHSGSRHERRSTHKKSFAPDPFSTTSHLPNEPGPIPRPYRDRALRWDTQSGVSVFRRLMNQEKNSLAHSLCLMPRNKAKKRAREAEDAAAVAAANQV